MKNHFWKGRKVFVTGHTGFKGGWLSLWLYLLGAKVCGYSLKPKKNSFFYTTNLGSKINQSIISSDIRDLKKLKIAIKKFKPSVIFHMAAQPIVTQSYREPLETFATNIIGTANLFEAARETASVKAIINITSDKCYKNQEKAIPFKESNNLGGSDPYSGSKACAEIITSVYQKSFFENKNINLASVRAGNVIGGGDWSDARLIPDIFKNSRYNKKILIRSPNSVRPWQHVLDALQGYILLAEKVLNNKKYIGAWNFGPNKKDEKKVSWIVKYVCKKIGGTWKIDKRNKIKEAKILKLNSFKSKSKLNWKPKWDVKISLDKTCDWYEAWKNKKNMFNFSSEQIISYLEK